MINVSDFKVFRDHQCSLMESSKDSTNNVYMTDSAIQVVNFDDVKVDYLANYLRGAHEKVKSVDALVTNRVEVDLLVEFKNGKLSQNKILEIANKAYDSVVIIGDIVDLSIRDIRETIDFVLVYNMDQNPQSYLNGHIIGKSKESHIAFGLNYLEGYLFRRVHICTKDEFEKKFVNTWR